MSSPVTPHVSHFGASLHNRGCSGVLEVIGPRRGLAKDSGRWMTVDEYVREHFDSYGRLASALTGNRHDAEDVLGTALLRIVEQWRRVERAASPTAYGRQIVVRTFLDSRRRGPGASETSTSDSSVLDQTTPDHADAVALSDEVRSLLRPLSNQQRGAIVLRYLLDQSDDEIALALGCSPATVRSHLSHARASMRLEADERELQ
jgi:RNA polymerase sigma-70 factor (sigma-E family)